MRDEVEAAEAAHTQALDQLAAAREELRRCFTDLAADAAESYAARVDMLGTEAVKRHHERALGLGPAGRGEVKGRLERVKSRAQELADKHLSPPSDNELTPAHGTASVGMWQRALDGLRAMDGYVGEILIDVELGMKGHPWLYHRSTPTVVRADGEAWNQRQDKLLSEIAENTRVADGAFRRFSEADSKLSSERALREWESDEPTAGSWSFPGY